MSMAQGQPSEFADRDDENPFVSTPIMTRSKKRTQHPDKDPKSSSTKTGDPVAKKKRLEAVQVAFANSEVRANSAAVSSSGVASGIFASTSQSSSQMVLGGQQGQLALDPLDLLSDTESDFSGIIEWTARELDSCGPVLGGPPKAASTSQTANTASSSQVAPAVASATPPPSTSKPRTRAAGRK